MGAQAKHSLRRSETVLRDLRILKLRTVYKMTYQQIADKEGLSVAGARKCYIRAISAKYDERDELGKKARMEELVLLDRLQQAVVQSALNGELRAVDRLVKISESRRKLLGLDAPAKVEVRHEDVDEQIEKLPPEVRDALLRHLAPDGDPSGIVERATIGGPGSAPEDLH